jgi:hypothetical protein
MFAAALTTKLSAWTYALPVNAFPDLACSFLILW